MSGDDTSRLRLRGLDRLIYFAPTLFMAYLSALCALLTLVTALFVTLPKPAALVGAGLFGLLVTLGLCALLYRAQSRELRFLRLLTAFDAAVNYERVMRVASESGWRVAHTQATSLIEVRIAGTLLSLGEMLVARFEGADVLVAAISDPRVGYSMSGRARCRAHVERLRLALSDIANV